MIYGSIPAGGKGTRLQPLGFSKELAPIGGQAVIEHLIERMVIAGVDKIFINTASDKMDLIQYLSKKSTYKNNLIFMARDRKGLMDGVISPYQFLRDDDEIIFGLPDTIWYPKNAYKKVIDFHPKSDLVLGLFDSGKPESYDSVVTDKNDKIESINVKVDNPKTKWTWGIGRIRVKIIPELIEFGSLQPEKIKIFGVALNHYIKKSPSYGLKLAKSSYLDIGTPEDFERAKEFIKKSL